MSAVEWLISNLSQQVSQYRAGMDEMLAVESKWGGNIPAAIREDLQTQGQNIFNLIADIEKASADKTRQETFETAAQKSHESLLRQLDREIDMSDRIYGHWLQSVAKEPDKQVERRKEIARLEDELLKLNLHDLGSGELPSHDYTQLLSGSVKGVLYDAEEEAFKAAERASMIDEGETETAPTGGTDARDYENYTADQLDEINRVIEDANQDADQFTETFTPQDQARQKGDYTADQLDEINRVIEDANRDADQFTETFTPQDKSRLNINEAARAAEQDVSDNILYDVDPRDMPGGTPPEHAPDPNRMKFTGAQRKAIEHYLGRGLVIAGPGSGKTTVLKERLFHLVEERGVKLHNILTLAYNKSAALELQARAKPIGEAHIKTLHAFARQIVKENLEDFGYTQMPQLPEQEDFLEPFIRRLMASESEFGQVDDRTAKAIVGNIERARANVTQGLFEPESMKGEGKAYAIAYESFKTQHNYIDFQDMLLLAADLLDRSAEVREEYQRRYPFVQIDEFQDVSPSEMRFLEHLSDNIIAVGDDDQAIYGFRGGDSAVMQDFAETARQYQVTENFRSTPEIVGMSDELIQGSQKRLPKELSSTRKSGSKPRYLRTSPQNIREGLRGELADGRDTAILVRTNHEVAKVREMLNKMELGLVGDNVTVSTIHKSKGLEWDKVLFLLNTLDMSGGVYRSFPSAHTVEELEEERRLFYVAMTRARDELVMLGREPKFLQELGFNVKGDVIDIDDSPVEEIGRDQVTESRRFRDIIGRAFHKFRARYQRVRYYQDMYDMTSDLPDVEVIENLNVAQLHRSKMEALGEELGITPTARDQKPAKLRGMDRMLAKLHRPSRTMVGGGLAGNIGGTLAGLTDPVSLTARNLLPFILGRMGRKIDNRLYPQARRPNQNMYRSLFHALPDAVRGSLPEDIHQSGLDREGKLRNFRYIQSNIDTVHKPFFYEFPDTSDGWEGESTQRPLFNEDGERMIRVTTDELEQLSQDRQRTSLHTDLDTTESTSQIPIRPYSEFGYEGIYQRPTPPRGPQELSRASVKLLGQVRKHLRESLRGDRTPSAIWKRAFRINWETSHRKLIRKINRYLNKYAEDEVINFKKLSGLLDKFARSNTDVSMGAEGGVHDIGGRVTDLHNEVFDLIEDVWNENSPYFKPSHWIGAKGKLHELPFGLGVADVEQSGDPLGSADTEVTPEPVDIPDAAPEPVVDTPDAAPAPRATSTPRQRSRGKLFSGLLNRRKKQYGQIALLVKTFNEAGEVLEASSGIYLGDGRAAISLHGIMGSEGGLPARGVVSAVGGGDDIDFTNMVAYDKELDLAIVELDKTAEGVKDLIAARFGRGAKTDQKLHAYGMGRRPGEDIGLKESIGRAFRIGESVSTFVGDPFYEVQSGAPIFSESLLGGTEVQGMVAGRGEGKYGFYPSHLIEALNTQTEAIGAVDPAEFGTRAEAEEIFQRKLQSQVGSESDTLAGLRGKEKMGVQLLLERERRGVEYNRKQIREQEVATQFYHATPDSKTADVAKDIAEFDRMDKILTDPLNTRGADFGRAVGRSRFGGAARKASDAIGMTSDMLKLAKSMKLVKSVGKIGGLALGGLEFLDIAEKLQYHTGDVFSRMTEEVAVGGNTPEIMERYAELLGEKEFYGGGTLGNIGKLTKGAFSLLWGGSDFSPLEESYFEKEGGLRDIGSTPGAGKYLEWAERLPVVDPALVAFDRLEKGRAGKLLDLIKDPTKERHLRDVESQTVGFEDVLLNALSIATPEETEGIQGLLGQRGTALSDELGGYSEEDIARSREREPRLRKSLVFLERRKAAGQIQNSPGGTVQGGY